MPWKYTALIKSGRISVPVEVRFLPSPTVPDTEPWATREQMNEIREMLRPAVELALKCHNDSSGSGDKYLDNPQFTSNFDVSLGYLVQESNQQYEKFDGELTWPRNDDDEEDQMEEEADVEENSGLRHLGDSGSGRRVTRTFVKASVLLRTEALNAEDERRQLAKSLGVKLDTLVHPHQENPGSPAPPSSSQNRNDPKESGANSSSIESTDEDQQRDSAATEEAATDVHNANDLGNTCHTRSPATNNSVHSGSQVGDDFWNIPPETYCEEKDDDTVPEDEYRSVGLNSPEWDHRSDETRPGYSPSPPPEDDNDGDDEELPDIDFTPPPTPVRSPVKEFTKAQKNTNKKAQKRVAVNNKSKSPKRFRLDPAEVSKTDHHRSTVDKENGILGTEKKKKPGRKAKVSLSLETSPKKKTRSKNTKATGEANDEIVEEGGSLADIFASVESGKKSKVSSGRRTRRDRKDSENNRLNSLTKDITRSPQKESHLISDKSRDSFQVNHFSENRTGVSAMSALVAGSSAIQNARPGTSSSACVPLSDVNPGLSSPAKGTGQAADPPSRPLSASNRRGKLGAEKKTRNSRSRLAASESDGGKVGENPANNRNPSLRTPAMVKDYGDKPTNSNRKLRSRNNSQCSDTEDGVQIVHEKEKRRRRRDMTPIIKQESLESLMPQYPRTETSTLMEFDPEMPVLLPEPVNSHRELTPPPSAPTLDREGSVSRILDFDRPWGSSFFKGRSSTSPFSRISPGRNSIERQFPEGHSVSGEKTNIHSTSATTSAFVPFASRPNRSPVTVNANATARSSASPVRPTSRNFSPVPSATVESARSFTPLTTVAPTTTVTRTTTLTGYAMTAPEANNSTRYLRPSRSSATSPLPLFNNIAEARRNSMSPLSSNQNRTIVAASPAPSSQPEQPSTSLAPRMMSTTIAVPSDPVTNIPSTRSRLADVVKSIQRESFEELESDRVETRYIRIETPVPLRSPDKSPRQSPARKVKKKKKRRPKELSVEKTSHVARPSPRTVEEVSPASKEPTTSVPDARAAPLGTRELPPPLKQIPSLKSILEQQDNNDLIYSLLEDQDYCIEEEIIKEVRQKSSSFAAILDNYGSDGESSAGTDEEHEAESSPDRVAYPSVYIKQMVEVSSQDLRNVLQPVNLEDTGPVTIAETELPFDADMDLYESIKVPTEYNLEDSYDLFSYDDDVDKVVDSVIANPEETLRASHAGAGNEKGSVLDVDEFPRLGLVGSPESGSSDDNPESSVNHHGVSEERRSSPGPSSRLLSALEKSPPPEDDVNTRHQRRSPSPPASSSGRNLPVRPLLDLMTMQCRLPPKQEVPGNHHHRSSSSQLALDYKREPTDRWSSTSRSSSRLSAKGAHADYYRDVKIKRSTSPAFPNRPMASTSRKSRLQRTPSPPPKGRRSNGAMPPPQYPAPRTPKKGRTDRSHNSNAVVAVHNGESASSVRERAASLIGNQVPPQAMTTRDMLTNTECMQTSMRLLSMIADGGSDQSNLEHVAGQLGMNSRLNRPSTSSASFTAGQETDVELVCKVKNRTRNHRGKIKKEKDDDSAGKEIVVRRRSSDVGSDDDEGEEDDELRRIRNDIGTAMIRELLSRCGEPEREEYVPQGDEFDLSQKSMCLLRFYPDYAKIRREEKITKKHIAELSLDQIKTLYDTYLRQNLLSIVRGSRPSERYEIYKAALTAPSYMVENYKRKLQNLYVQLPFTDEQTRFLYDLLKEDFPATGPSLAVDCRATSLQLGDRFVLPHYVLLPEAFIRIYACLGEMTIKRAEIFLKDGNGAAAIVSSESEQRAIANR